MLQLLSLDWLFIEEWLSHWFKAYHLDSLVLKYNCSLLCCLGNMAVWAQRPCYRSQNCGYSQRHLNAQLLGNINVMRKLLRLGDYALTIGIICPNLLFLYMVKWTIMKLNSWCIQSYNEWIGSSQYIFIVCVHSKDHTNCFTVLFYKYILSLSCWAILMVINYKISTTSVNIFVNVCWWIPK